MHSGLPRKFNPTQNSSSIGKQSYSKLIWLKFLLHFPSFKSFSKAPLLLSLKYFFEISGNPVHYFVQENVVCPDLLNNILE